jgi:hypothetical protein
MDTEIERIDYKAAGYAKHEARDGKDYIEELVESKHTTSKCSAEPEQPSHQG